MEIKLFTKNYISRLKDALDQVDPVVIEEIVAAFDTTLSKKSKIYILGNGGSSATASHMVNDLGAGLRRRDIVNLDVISLGDNSPTITAIANDIGYENIFFMQMKGLLVKEDVVIAISCSGNSSNIVKAVNYAKEIGCIVIGMTGFNGGKLKEKSDINFHVNVPQDEYGLVEDLHMILDHIIYSFYIQRG
jgi:D-sedoheptulose 7-phosphate isomerase